MRVVLLKKKQDFEQLFRRGKHIQTNFFTLRVLYHKNEQSPVLRLGVIAGKKLSASAVRRNRIKRQVREYIRRQRALFLRPASIVVTPTIKAVALEKSALLEDELRAALERAKLIFAHGKKSR